MRYFLLFVCTVMVITSCNRASAQVASQDEVDPALVRRFWIAAQTRTRPLSPPPYTLTEAERLKYKGSFGIDLSHYSFDLSSSGTCANPNSYNDKKCSCTVDLKQFSSNGILFIYSKATDGAAPDLSFPRFWGQMAAEHKQGTMFRGAFHYLRPGIDAKTQADAFLSAIKENGSDDVGQLSPALDMEWSNKKIVPNTPAFRSCPMNRRTQDDKGNWYCDMWYTMNADDIVSLAKSWIDRVSAATGKKVVIYTNPKEWWNPVLGQAGDELAKTQAQWPSRYPGAGPKFNPSWTAEGGSSKWQMPPLPHGASYPTDKYNIADFWQFSESGLMPTREFQCNGQSVSRTIDLDWVPVNASDYKALFAPAP